MSADPSLLEQVEVLAEAGPYRPAAYLWVLRVIEETRRRLERDEHIDANELLEGHRELAVREFGPMAYDVFCHWGMRTSHDLGRVVFDLVEGGILRKTDEDSLEDFDHGYDFHEVFVERYPW